LGYKVFMVTDNAHLIALNRVTGGLVWEAVMPDEAQHYGATCSPLIVKDMVIAGVSGGVWGIRGFLAAYKAATGERVWRHWTVPGKGEPGYDTWKGKAVTFGGGGTWLTGSYDPETDTLYWATGNPAYETDYQQGLSFAVSPPQNRWPGFGLIYSKVPSLPNGSDGAAYFAESGGGAPGFDADYTQMQLDQLTRLYLVTRSPQVLRLVNLVVNQLWPLVNTTNFEFNTSGGTRHAQANRYIPFTSPGPALSASAGGQTYLMPFLQRETAEVESAFSALTSYWNPGGEYDFGLEAATFVLLGLVTS